MSGRVLRVACCVLVTGTLAGCTSARTNLGTSDNACYLALPAATRAVEHHGTLVSVHLVTLKSLKRAAPGVYKALDTHDHTSQKVCVVAFSGHFTRASVRTPRGRPSGRLAVAVLTNPSNALIGTIILLHAERPFGSRSIVPF